ncbi:MAG: alpha/beta fold hydrolase [Methyloligellaceae bacterium]
MTDLVETQNWREGFYTSQDGLRLYARHYPAKVASGRPVVCLPGLTRNATDFDALAKALSGHPERPRDVYCVDYRGRGSSDHDTRWKNYTPYIELIDVLDFMTVTGLHDAAIVGTSRGGIIAMQMSVMRPTMVGVAVLNDIGPVIEPAGLARIIGYVGKTPVPSTWQEAARVVRNMNEKFFPAVTDDEWLVLARQWFSEKDGRPAPSYDPSLANTMGEIDLSKKIPEMWPQFTALSAVPTLLIRGANSDLLSEETAGKMAARHKKLKRLNIEGQGHAPLLRDDETITEIARFLADTDPESGALH